MPVLPGTMPPAAEKETWRIGSRRLEVSRLGKVFYPSSGFTKGDVLSYYRDVAPVVVPHLKDRALTLKRYPDGVEGNFFYEKRCPPYRPSWVKTVAMTRKRDQKEIAYCVINDAASLIWTANLGNLELHTSLAKRRALNRPTSLVFDLDPDPSVGVLGCARVGVWVREVLDRLGLECIVKSSGSKGLQVFCPLNTPVTYEQTGPVAHAIARMIEEDHPANVVTRMKKELRVGKVLIDWSQNDDHKTTVSVYSLRARPRPTVSTPVTWDEVERALDRSDAEALAFEPNVVKERIEAHGDLFEAALKLKQKLPSVPFS